MTKILDGNKVAADIRAEMKLALEERKHTNCFPPLAPPCLAVVLCSDDPASGVYVKRKQEACREVGINSFLVKPFDGTDILKLPDARKHLNNLIHWLNDDDSVQGILVQLPLPKPLSQFEVFDEIDPYKDVDVFSPENVGLLLQGRPRFIPCTPQGIQELLTRHGVVIEGKRVCIINRSDVVGKPLSALLCQNNRQANATVTLCHDHTPPERLKEACLNSDIIVVAVGKPKFLTADMVPDGAVVVDVGITRVEGSKKIIGDVDYENVAPKCSAISPVPGGVGPMTVTMLLRNTMLAQQVQLSHRTSGS